MRGKNMIRPDRERRVERPFSWMPFRLLTSGMLARLGQPAKLLYFFLCLVADKRGVSFYSDPRITSTMQLTDLELDQARNELTRLDLLAYDGHLYQLLSLPPSLPSSISRVDEHRDRRAERAPGSTEDPQHVGRLVHQFLEELKER